MAVTHLAFDDQTTHGRLIRRALNQIENGVEDLNDAIATMALMLSGDGSDPAHFTYLTAKFGFASDAVAKAAWEELNSVQAKLTTDSSVSNVRAAQLQAFAKFR